MHIHGLIFNVMYNGYCIIARFNGSSTMCENAWERWFIPSHACFTLYVMILTFNEFARIVIVYCILIWLVVFSINEIYLFSCGSAGSNILLDHRLQAFYELRFCGYLFPDHFFPSYDARRLGVEFILQGPVFWFFCQCESGTVWALFPSHSYRIFK